MVSLVALTVLTCSPDIAGLVADKDLPGPGGVTLRQRASEKLPRVFTVDAAGKVVWAQVDFGALSSRPPAF